MATNTDRWVEVDPLTEETASFVALANALDGVREFGLQKHGDKHDSKVARHFAAKTGGVQSRPLESGAQRLLRVAWQTELAARLSDSFDDPDLRRVGSLSLPMQAYYSLFNTYRALTIAAGNPIDGHAAMRRDFSGSRAGAMPGPWGITMTGDPRLETLSCTLVPLPSGFEPYKFNPMERSHPPEAHLYYALLMARRWTLDQSKRIWKENKDNLTKKKAMYKRLPPGKTDELVEKLRPTTMMDLLYQLRRRVNYEKVDEYLSAADDVVVKRYYDGILYLMSTGLLCMETQLAILVGVDALENAADAWIRRAQRIGPDATRSLKERLTAIRSEVPSPSRR